MLRPFRPRRFHRAGDKAAGTLRGNAVSRPRSSSLRRVPAPFPWRRITRLSPFAGAETSTTRLAVQGTAGPFAINFSRPFRCASLDRKKFPAHPRTSAPGRARLRPRGERLSNG
uniref:Single-stranded DNA-binding protein n=1 Tax=Klebsiella pneumoniae TaxID=573 RepID=A0A6H0A8C5_KLEPN|nr:Single-stranded DNA-binding protein [Klebsiella pneumoniae]